MKLFVLNILGLVLVSLFNAFFAWLFLETTFELGFWVWFGMCLIGTQVVRGGILVQEMIQDLTR